ncbi:MAG: hypothetical protein HYT15_01040 [Candidatus Magasanikbacteria bacterium]|nr:hypothetical protein [Candidatus Magasanikbacteria bacterium]
MGFNDFFADSATRSHQGGSTSDTAKSGFSPAPGRTSLTSDLPAATQWDREAERAIGRANRHLDELPELIRAAKDTFGNVQFQEAKAAIGQLENKLSLAQDNAGRAKGILGHGSVENKALLEQLDMLEQRIQSAKEDVAPILARKPPETKSVPFSLPGVDEEPDAVGKWEKEQTATQDSWETTQTAINSLPPDEREPVGYEQESCRVRGPVADNAFEGIKLFIKARAEDDIDHAYDITYPSFLVGPGKVGPYKLDPALKGGKVVFFLAHHSERGYPEWVIGPDNVEEFRQNIDAYVGAARTALPGSKKIPGSQADGADKFPHDPSMLELEAFGKAPYQQQLGAGQSEAPFNQPKEHSGMFGVMWDGLTEGMDEANGGSSAVGARNAHIRLTDYVEKAREIARQLMADVNSGKMQHLDARGAAVAGRNDLMRGVRERMSPSARYTSQKIKADDGISEGAMVKKKVPDLLNAARKGGDGMRVLGQAGSPEDLRKFLGEESEAWSKYLKALEAGEPSKSVTSKAVQEMSQQPSVSRAIINSAGKNNQTVTRLVKLGRVAGAAGAAAGVVDMAQTIYNAEDGERLHVAAGELGGFVGGIIGAELGAMAAVWVASLIISGPAAPVVLVVSLIGGMVGGAIGAQAGHEMPNMATAALGEGLNAVVTPGSGQAGGYAGMHQRSSQAGKDKMNTAERLRQIQDQLDSDIRQAETEIKKAKDRDDLDRWQLQRLNLLNYRDQVGGIYQLLRAGKINETQVYELMGEEVVKPEPQECAPEEESEGGANEVSEVER